MDKFNELIEESWDLYKHQDSVLNEEEMNALCDIYDKYEVLGAGYKPTAKDLDYLWDIYGKLKRNNPELVN